MTVPKPPHPLRLWREAHGVSQKTLAEQTGLTQGMISHIELYKHVPIRHALDALVQVTHLHVDAIVRPDAFLDSHPGFSKSLPLSKPVRRGRPPKPTKLKRRPTRG